MAPTLKQRRVARNLVEAVKNNSNLTAGQIVENSRYSKSMAIKPSVVIQSAGVQEALEDLGFSIEGADKVVSNLLYKGKKEETKLKAADLIYKRRGAYEDTKQGAGKTLIIQVSGETATRYGLSTHNKPENSSE